MPTPAKTWLFGLLAFLLLAGFDHHHHHHGGGHSSGGGASLGCGGSSHSSHSSKDRHPVPVEHWRVTGEVVASDPGEPAVATLKVTLQPTGAAVRGARVTVAGVALTEAEAGTYVGELPPPEPGALVEVEASGPRAEVRLRGQMPAPAAELALKDDALAFTERGHADALAVTERDPEGAAETVRLEDFAEDSRLEVALPPMAARAEVQVAVERATEPDVGGEVTLVDATARLQPAPLR